LCFVDLSSGGNISIGLSHRKVSWLGGSLPDLIAAANAGGDKGIIHAGTIPGLPSWLAAWTLWWALSNRDPGSGAGLAVEGVFVLAFGVVYQPVFPSYFT
jgi:hypothetical protein